MRWYAQMRRRLVLQVTADLLAALWTVGAVLAGRLVYDGIAALRRPATALSDAGGRIESTFGGAARTAGDVPLVGDALARAFDPGVTAGADVARAGQEYADTIATVALTAGLLVPVFLLLPVLLGWLPLRVRYARRAGAAAAARDGDLDLLALRALARAPIRRLREVDPDPIAGWRELDPEIVRGLAALELETVGLRPPPYRAVTPDPGDEPDRGDQPAPGGEPDRGRHDDREPDVGPEPRPGSGRPRPRPDE